MFLNYLIEIAKQRGLDALTAWVLTDNTRMMHVLKKCGYPTRYKIEGDLYYVTIELKKQLEK